MDFLLTKAIEKDFLKRMGDKWRLEYSIQRTLEVTGGMRTSQGRSARLGARVEAERGPASGFGIRIPVSLRESRVRLATDDAIAARAALN